MSVPDRERRTIPASAKRIQDFRKRGEIARSTDIVAVSTLLGGSIGLWLSRKRAGESLVLHLRESFRALATAEIGHVPTGWSDPLVSVLGPVFVGSIVGYLIACAVQLGWPPAFRPLKFDPSRPLIFSGLSGLVDLRASATRTLLAAAKIAAVAGAAAWAVMPAVEEARRRSRVDFGDLGQLLESALVRTATFAIVAWAMLAAVDFVLKNRELAAKMRMTPEEAKREYKEQEGSPEVRRRRRQKMREMSQRRHDAAVRQADVVLVNPTEYAVALRYRPERDRAPIVVAKGRALVAERIRELARKHGVPIVSRPPLTRLIHKVVPEGKEIKPELYAAIAEVLAYVYRLRKEARRS